MVLRCSGGNNKTTSVAAHIDYNVDGANVDDGTQSIFPLSICLLYLYLFSLLLWPLLAANVAAPLIIKSASQYDDRSAVSGSPSRRQVMMLAAASVCGQSSDSLLPARSHLPLI